MIPGPVEVDTGVLTAMAQPPLGHTSASFIEISLDNLTKALLIGALLVIVVILVILNLLGII